VSDENPPGDAPSSGPAPEHGPIDPLDFRRVLGHFPTGVTVVAAAPGGSPHGMTVGSFFSISLDPPLVGLCVGKGSTSWPDIEPAGRFAVSVLGDDQAEVSNRFARSDGSGRFDGIAWHAGPTGSPVLDDALAHIECVTEQVVEAGDHWIVIGRVVDLGVDREGGPLLFFQGAYGSFDPEV
jgi:3-hydroxy-9,10-secoandrosta-1,3,5(10)-triene-9,17-dione monooxygenase reductase component